MLVRCKDGTAIEVAGDAFQVKGAFANAATSAAPLFEGFLELSLSSQACLASWGCQVDDLKEAKRSEVGCVDSLSALVCCRALIASSGHRDKREAFHCSFKD